MKRQEHPIQVEYEEVKAVGPRSVLLDFGVGLEAWIPYSACPELEGLEKDSGPGEFECPYWLAEREGLD